MLLYGRLKPCSPCDKTKHIFNARVITAVNPIHYRRLFIYPREEKRLKITRTQTKFRNVFGGNWRVFMAVSVRRFHLLLLCPGKGVVGGEKM